MSDPRDYYSYKPLLRLERPLAICGLPGAAVGETARVLTMLSGLPLVSVDRRAEHVLGRSVELEQVLAGSERRLRVERDVVDEALQRSTHPVIALSNVTFTDASLRRELLARCDVLHLALDLERAVERIRRESEQDPRRHYALRDGEPFHDERVRARLRFLLRIYREVPRSVPIEDRSALEVGRMLLREIGGEVSG